MADLWGETTFDGRLLLVSPNELSYIAGFIVLYLFMTNMFVEIEYFLQMTQYFL